MNEITRTTAALAAVAVAMHEAFDTSTHTPDSLELWVALAEEAARQFAADTAPPQWIPVFTMYRQLRTEAQFHPGTGRVEILNGPLAQTSHLDLDRAARAVAGSHPLGSYVDGISEPPTWRLHGFGHMPGAFARLRPAASS
ncbi:hypothetical protein [Nocardia wallacei]|uniref:hypothetical protein n=1 Tax=Nocardia wallacei TaxID=480035 RepID=UPI0024551B50|nr:hypothetical protein [Nocardia wallacei]